MDVLGIFGREPLDFANMWSPPGAQDPIAYAFRMFRNYDGNGGQFPPDRARRVPADESTSVGRNSGTTAGYATVDARLTRRVPLGGRSSVDVMIEAFNLFNRANFIEETNQSSFVVFGTGSFPSSPAPAYGRYTLTAPPRQVQLAARLSF